MSAGIRDEVLSIRQLVQPLRVELEPHGLEGLKLFPLFPGWEHGKQAKPHGGDENDRNTFRHPAVVRLSQAGLGCLANLRRSSAEREFRAS